MLQAIAWDRVVELNAVRALGELAHQRWKLDLALVATDGAIRPLVWPAAGQVERLRPPADDDRAEGEAYLRQLVTPIHVDGRAMGWVMAATDHATRSGLLQGERPVLQELMEKIAAEIVAFQHAHSGDGHGEPDSSAEIGTRHDYGKIIGRSRPMRQLYRLLDRVIDSDSTVLIEGENGTGKELIAKAIHYNSKRKHRPFVVQNCSAFNDNLLDSELFGHRKGAFTGAVNDKLGLFAVADGGTFFLDEIGDMSPSLQVKLLRVLQEGTFIPVGDTKSRHVDVRIIAATNRRLRAMMEAGQFREDLYYRVNVLNITPPPLRQRAEDILLLVDHFLDKQQAARKEPRKQLTRECLQLLMRHDWPGNVRELENEIERLVVLASETRIPARLLSARICRAGSATGHQAAAAGGLPSAMVHLERNMIHEVLKRNQWNKTRAARELRISRRNLIRKVQKYSLDPEQC